ncbi:MAG: FxsA family protein [Myxococcota bacterium]
MGLLALLFIVVPAVELALLIQVGTVVGVLPTFGLIVLTGVVGAALAKQQGFGILAEIQARTQRGEMPGEALVDGAIVLFAGALLLTPGLLTDAVGFACLVPLTRQLIKGRLRAFISSGMQSGRIQVVEFRGPSGPSPFDRSPPRPRGPVIDVEAEPYRPDR